MLVILKYRCIVISIEKERRKNMDKLQLIINTPLSEIDNNVIVIKGLEAYVFENWEGVQNRGRWFGWIKYRTSDNRLIIGQGTSAKGFASKENALKAARVDFENNMKEFYKQV